MKELIRTNIMNLNLKQWEKIHEIEDVGFINITPKELYDLIGFDGGMFLTNIANEREYNFIKDFYIYGNNQKLL